jgi:hypothetical protein
MPRNPIVFPPPFFTHFSFILTSPQLFTFYKKHWCSRPSWAFGPRNAAHVSTSLHCHSNGWVSVSKRNASTVATGWEESKAQSQVAIDQGQGGEMPQCENDQM